MSLSSAYCPGKEIIFIMLAIGSGLFLTCSLRLVRSSLNCENCKQVISFCKYTESILLPPFSNETWSCAMDTILLEYQAFQFWILEYGLSGIRTPTIPTPCFYPSLFSHCPLEPACLGPQKPLLSRTLLCLCLKIWVWTMFLFALVCIFPVMGWPVWCPLWWAEFFSIAVFFFSRSVDFTSLYSEFYFI
jgi:hypothetical protein